MPSASTRSSQPVARQELSPSSPRAPLSPSSLTAAAPRGLSPGPVALADGDDAGARRPSVQFKPASKVGLPTGNPKRAVSSTRSRKMSSPPPPPSFRPRVSFDNFDPDLAPIFDTMSFTLNKKHKDYEYTKRSRTFLCGYDANEYSEYALEWLIDELVDDGDEIVCLRVVEEDAPIAGGKSVREGLHRDEAERVMRQIELKNTENKAINLVLEFAVGKVQDVIDDMIKIYEPAILIVGTRGRSLGGFQGLLPGSVSKWVLQHSPVPVIVVRPNSKREKNKRKRQKDPTRTGYRDLLDKSNPQGEGHLLDRHRHSTQFASRHGGASDAEAAAVAAAIGFEDQNLPSPGYKGEALTHFPSTGTAGSERTDVSALSPGSEFSGRSESPEDMRSPARVLKSPNEVNLESPTLSEMSSEGDNAEEEEERRNMVNAIKEDMADLALTASREASSPQSHQVDDGSDVAHDTG